MSSNFGIQLSVIFRAPRQSNEAYYDAFFVFQSFIRVQGKHSVDRRGQISFIERRNPFERIKTEKYAVDQRSRCLHRPRDEADDELDEAAAQTVANGHHDELPGQISTFTSWEERRSSFC